MKFTFVTLFPELIKGYFDASIVGRAKERGLIEIEFFNPRDFSKGKNRGVDAQMVGGGAGMLLSPEPLGRAIEHIKASNSESHTVFLSPVGKPFRQNDAKRLGRKRHIILVSGRYEGVDERVIEIYVDELFSIGDFVLTGGELPSLVLCDAISRTVPGVLGNSLSLDEESFEEPLLEAPSFTKPHSFREKRVISDYLKGNHAKISSLKRLMALSKTKYFRPDLFTQFRSKEIGN
jgi:tRNA (guanine37-N1)-methyltransferase